MRGGGGNAVRMNMINTSYQNSGAGNSKNANILVTLVNVPQIIAVFGFMPEYAEKTCEKPLQVHTMAHKKTTRESFWHDTQVFTSTTEEIETTTQNMTIHEPEARLKLD